jgi:hypothetical protein
MLDAFLEVMPGLVAPGKELAADVAAEVARLAAAAARGLAGGGLEAAELALRAGLTQIGARLLEPLLAADRDTGARGRTDCGAGPRAQLSDHHRIAVLR